MAKSKMLIEFEKKYCKPAREAYLKRTGKKDSEVGKACSIIKCKHMTTDHWCKPWDETILKHHMEEHAKTEKK
jgi:hypothetical protein